MTSSAQMFFFHCCSWKQVQFLTSDISQAALNKSNYAQGKVLCHLTAYFTLMFLSPHVFPPSLSMSLCVCVSLCVYMCAFVCLLCTYRSVRAFILPVKPSVRSYIHLHFLFLKSTLELEVLNRQIRECD